MEFSDDNEEKKTDNTEKEKDKNSKGNDDKITDSDKYYWDKVTQRILYDQLKTLYDLYINNESLRDMHHLFDTNKNECFNKLVTKFVPKMSYLCGSIARKPRVYVAAGINSVGYVLFYLALYQILGVKYTTLLHRQHTG